MLLRLVVLASVLTFYLGAVGWRAAYGQAKGNERNWIVLSYVVEDETPKVLVRNSDSNIVARKVQFESHGTPIVAVARREAIEVTIGKILIRTKECELGATTRIVKVEGISRMDSIE